MREAAAGGAPAGPQPFLKWAGGKRHLLPQYRPHFPESWHRYHEPFVGSAAVFFDLAPARAILADSNAALINCYVAVRDHAGELIERLAELQAHHGPRQYYGMRHRYNTDGIERVEHAALLIYLNRTCYNGLYRVNSRGEFNVPVGRYARPRICDAGRLRAASAALAAVELRVQPFTECAAQSDAGDFVYIDPPYQPVRRASFTSYTAGGFGEAEQHALADIVRRLDARGCRVMLSNSDTRLVRRLYEGYRIVRIRARRAINSDPAGRTEVGEVLVMNY